MCQYKNATEFWVHAQTVAPLDLHGDEAKLEKKMS